MPPCGSDDVATVVQGACDNTPGQTPSGQYFCSRKEDQLCLYHDSAAWCTQTDLTDCLINQPLRNGDCKVPENLLTRMDRGRSAESVGVYFGPEVRCRHHSRCMSGA